VKIHVIKRGESLRHIANQYGVKTSKIISANELFNPDQLVIGQSLVIPDVPLQHKVIAEEKLWQIAQRYGTTIEAIMKVNQIDDPALIYPGTVLTIPKKRTVIDVNAYSIHSGEKGEKVVRDSGKYLTYASPFAYLIQEDGGIIAIDDAATIRATFSEKGIPMMCITNFTSESFGSSLAHEILSSRELQERLINNVVSTMKSKGYEVLNVDFENIFPADRERYNQFLKRVVDRLHQEGYIVSSALAPKINDAQQGLLYEAHDYAAHGRIVDFVVLMTYEWGYRLGPPQAISPLNQIKHVLDYAVSVIPREKIFMGFQLYARDWLLPHVDGQEAETFDMQEAIQRAVHYGATINYNKETESPFYRYIDEQGRTHEVWFEDARSAQAKFDIVKSYNLRGISYWVLGYPFPQNWVLLQENFQIRKLK
jgi:spore germination protein